MKKIISSIGVLVFVATMAAAGTGAFFSDTETSTGNVFTAGALDLKIDSVAHINGLVCYNGEWVVESEVVWDPVDARLELVEGADVAGKETAYNLANPSNVPKAGDACAGTWEMTDLGASNTFFNYGDLKPGDNGENTLSLHVYNNDAYMCALVHNVVDADNSQTEPESDVDVDGLVSGELAEELDFFIWEDDGDNIYEPQVDGRILAEGEDGAGIAGSYPLYTPQTGRLVASTTKYVGVYWCYGTLTRDGASLSCNGAPVTNVSQTDSLSADITFYVEQARNNAQFTCPTVVTPDPEKVVVTANDLAETLEELTAGPTKWLFYNDSNDSIMTINQFAGLAGVNDIVAGPGNVGAAQMTLDTGANPRYNIATYKYKDVKLADIGSLTYRIYDASASAQTPYLHFNVDFLNNDTWQRRLVQVPTGVTEDTWTTVDALAGTWTYSGATWPVGLVDVTGTTPGTTGRTWAEILANYPNAETRSTDSFFGVRVGHPGPVGEESYVDWVEFDGEITDFEN